MSMPPFSSDESQQLALALCVLIESGEQFLPTPSSSTTSIRSSSTATIPIHQTAIMEGSSTQNSNQRHGGSHATIEGEMRAVLRGFCFNEDGSVNLGRSAWIFNYCAIVFQDYVDGVHYATTVSSRQENALNSIRMFIDQALEDRIIEVPPVPERSQNRSSGQSGQVNNSAQAPGRNNSTGVVPEHVPETQEVNNNVIGETGTTNPVIPAAGPSTPTRPQPTQVEDDSSQISPFNTAGPYHYVVRDGLLSAAGHHIQETIPADPFVEKPQDKRSPMLGKLARSVSTYVKDLRRTVSMKLPSARLRRAMKKKD